MVTFHLNMLKKIIILLKWFSCSVNNWPKNLLYSPTIYTASYCDRLYKVVLRNDELKKRRICTKRASRIKVYVFCIDLMIELKKTTRIMMITVFFWIHKLHLARFHRINIQRLQKRMVAIFLDVFCVSFQATCYGWNSSSC